MTFTIGRAGGDVAMREPKTTDFDGQTVTINGDIIASSFADAVALRQQLLGMLEEDTPVVPITWGADDHLNGYYTIKSVSVPSDVISKTRYYYPYTIVAERVGQYARPVFELMSIGALRTNSHSIVAADTFDYTWRPLSAIPVQSATTFSTGNLRTPSDASASAYFLKYNTPAAQFTTAYFVQPSQFYEGACKLEVSYDSGSTWRAVVGRYIEGHRPGRHRRGTQRVALRRQPVGDSQEVLRHIDVDVDRHGCAGRRHGAAQRHRAGFDSLVVRLRRQ